MEPDIPETSSSSACLCLHLARPLRVMNPPLAPPDPLLLLLVAYIAWSLELD